MGFFDDVVKPSGETPPSADGGFFADVVGVNRPKAAPTTIDPFERAALRTANSVKPPGGRQEGYATERPDFGLIPRTPLEVGLTVAGGPVGGRVLRTGAALIGAALEPSDAEAGIGGLFNRVRRGEGLIPKQLDKVIPKSVDRTAIESAGELMNAAAARGITLTWAEALEQVRPGTGLTNAQRIVESSPGGREVMSPVMAQRPGQVDTAARSVMDTIAPANPVPSTIGSEVGQTARVAMAESPVGQILSDAMWNAGRRVSPENAGTVIQKELGEVHKGREGMRSALADQDYTAARNAPATIPTNGAFREADVTKTYLNRPDIPILLNDAERGAARQNWIETNSQTRKVPILGELPTEFAQVNVSPVLQNLEVAIDSAKGSVRSGLEAARSALFTKNGELDGTVAGLHNSRMAITDLIDQASRAGANNTVRELEGALKMLDNALESVPAYRQARQNFEAASAPLEAFSSNRVPGQVVERDQYGRSFVMPPERVAASIQAGGPTAVREFNSVATPAAREAFEQRIVTQVLDDATKGGVDISSGSIRAAIRQNEDILRQHPGVRDRLENVAIARDGLASIEGTPLGQLAKRDITTKNAIETLFPRNPLPNSEHEISVAVGELAKRNPAAARDLVRAHVEATFNGASQALQGGFNQYGGANFAKVIAGNTQQRANLEAAVSALPNGQEVWTGFEKFLQIVEATGKRQPIGSRTAFNDLELKDLSSSGVVENVVKSGAKPMTAIRDAWSRWQLGRNLDSLARILTDPGSERALRTIAARPMDEKSVALTGHIIASRAALAGSENVGPALKAIQGPVQPSAEEQ